MSLEKVFNLVQFLLGLAFNIAIVVGLVVAIFWAFNSSFAWGQDFAYDMVADGQDFDVEFILDDETPIAEVARRLEEMGVISNRWLFQLELFLIRAPRVYNPGTFLLNTNMSSTVINQTLRARPQGQAAHLVVRIVEGWTIRDMANYFEYRGFFSAEEFIEAADAVHFTNAFLRDIPERENTLEGYIFPETYFIPLNPMPAHIISRALNHFEQIFDEAFHYRADELGLTMDEVVIIASMIEAEARFDSERPIISQIIHSRLDGGYRLELNSTIAYVLDIRRDRLSEEDKQNTSPFNTFLYGGLPPWPVSNPSQASLHAALYPAGTDYFYFVLESFEAGTHRFYTRDNPPNGD